MSTATVPAHLTGRPVRPRRADSAGRVSARARAERSARDRHPAGRARSARSAVSGGPVLLAIDSGCPAASPRPAGALRPGALNGGARALRLVPLVDVPTGGVPGGSAVGRGRVAGQAVVGSFAVPLLAPAPAGVPVRWGPRPAVARPSARPAGRPAPRPAPVRLTRRARLLITVLATAALVGGLLAVLGTPQVGSVPSVGSLPSLGSMVGGGSPPVAAERVTVRPGDTLWAIAERVAPGADPRETVAQIESLNHLSA